MKAKIDWLPWEKKSLMLAKELDRPILLAISAVWCHWCHVMDDTTYANPDVAEIIERRYVPIRVDNDQRPDINRRYNVGGWPTAAILTPSGKTITGTTYEPPEEMVNILNDVADFYESNKDKLISAPHEPKIKVKSAPSAGKIPVSAIEDFIQIAKRQYDPAHGGFGYEPKFPMADALDALLAIGFDRRDPEIEKIVTATLRKMAAGEVFDRIGGGFFRYATRNDWSAPHFEKMLEDNAKLLKLYIQAHLATGEADFLATARRVYDYINHNLRGEHGFYGSQNANESYYRLSESERAKEKTPDIDRIIYINWNALAISSYLLFATVTEAAKAADFALRTLDYIWEMGFSLDDGLGHYLLDGESMVSGLLADHVLMINTLIDAYESTGRDQYIDQAVQLSEFMKKKLWDEELGAFSDRPVTEKVGEFFERLAPITENSQAIAAITRLGRLIGRDDLLHLAEENAGAFADHYREYGLLAGEYAKAVYLLSKPVVDISIIGEEPLSDTLTQAAQTCFVPRKLLRRGENAKTKIHSEIPGAYICVDGRCLKPVGNPEELTKRLHEAT